ncbi:hypothetical protein B0T26DRAFT_721284 [Lasiosphaeria miniovina]|uniref:Dienelactone hydrolase domain-containing protein n=1 Tax=Lasiosphaeria miniovina TaxID=1954250 RepID=A0AA40A4U7_9PEZI|nr:uncharacterized protein B0T26DRAFT_721284 [Lasiosphaeria miniovina]KAK0709358.1 hypothetical protein B0T26DRAFT_721284 [Lasiosphaeria miniovina]
MERVTCPASLAISDKDMAVAMDQVRMTEKIWERKKGAVDTEEMVVYPGANHGFTNRVDHFNENLPRQCQEAEDQAVRWFANYLKL